METKTEKKEPCYLLTSDQRTVLLNYLAKQSYGDVYRLIPGLMTLPQLKEHEKNENEKGDGPCGQ